MELTPSAWHLWVLAALVAGVLELKLSGFVMLWFALGALCAALVAALGVGVDGQLLSFTAVSLALFGASRTLFKRAFMRSAVRMKVGPEAMVGEEALVVEALGEEGGGTVRIHGELWMARTLSGALGEGERVVVEGVDGLKLWVRRRGTTSGIQLQDSHRKEGLR